MGLGGRNDEQLEHSLRRWTWLQQYDIFRCIRSDSWSGRGWIVVGNRVGHGFLYDYDRRSWDGRRHRSRIRGERRDELRDYGLHGWRNQLHDLYGECAHHVRAG